MKNNFIKKNNKKILYLFFLFCIFFVSFFFVKSLFNDSLKEMKECQNKEKDTKECLLKKEIIKKKYTFLKKRKNVYSPKKLKSVYFSAYAASSNVFLNRLINEYKKNGVNAVFIDIKEKDGKVSFDMTSDQRFSKFFKKNKPKTNNILRNIEFILERLKKEGIYTIARIVVFKDNYLSKKRPDLAVKKPDKNTLWEDFAGNHWLDTNAKEVWDYNLGVAKSAMEAGFNEINLDYVRYPSDGPLNKIYFPFSDKTIKNDRTWGRAKNLDNFFTYFNEEIKKDFPHAIISADLFGYTSINNDDLGIGQVLETALLNLDYVYLMTYPSHFTSGFLGKKYPDNHPYEVFDFSASSAVKKLNLLNEKIEKAKEEKSNSIVLKNNFSKEIKSYKSISKDKIRFWLQAFSCSWCKKYQKYTKFHLDEQKRGIYENNLYSWALWNPASRYPTSWTE